MNNAQIKICGFTIPEQAEQAILMGADAIGMIFYPESPRHLDIGSAAGIVSALSDPSKAVGVFVEMDFDRIAETASKTGIRNIQLHNEVSDEFVLKLKDKGFFVIQVFKITGKELLEKAEKSSADSILVECSKGILPGGNGTVWDWGSVSDLSGIRPFILAGGLSPENAIKALTASGANGLDVSSGVEDAPGIKNMKKVREFIETVKKQKLENITGKVLP